MAKLILSRTLQALAVLFIVSLLTFALLAAAGGDALTALSSDPRISSEAIAELRRVYGLDQSFIIRYWRWLGGILRGDFGYSLYFHLPVQKILWPRFWRTLVLTLAALAIAWTFALGLGIAAAKHRGRLVDRLCSLLVLLGSSTPRLVLALIALAVAVRTSWFGAGGSAADLQPGEWILRLIPVALVLSVPSTALFLAQTRAAVRQGIDSEFARAARAKGLPEKTLLLRHVLRPSLNPLITIFGYSLGGLMSGSVIVEKVLGWPGLGDLSVTAVLSRDVPLLLVVVLVIAAAVLAGNLMADVLLRLNDPRLR